MNNLENRLVITIVEYMPNKFMANSQLPLDKSAEVLIKIAVNFIAQDAVNKHEAKKLKEGGIINPHTGNMIPTNKN